MHDCEREELARAIHALTHALRDATQENKIQFQWMVTHHQFATKADLIAMESRIIAAIRMLNFPPEKPHFDFSVGPVTLKK